ncbi:MAG: type IV secretion system DNA-binding domain-containing protein [Steroidobacteraceae bacterium]
MIGGVGPRDVPRLAVVLLAALGSMALARGLRRAPRDRYCRGARLEAAPRRRRRRAEITLAGVPLAPLEETKHFKLIGTTGTGKSTAIAELLTALLARGDRAIIADPDAGYLARFHSCARGDVILNPFEPRALKWDPFAEITAPEDPDQLAASLIAAGEDASAREWRGYARTFLASLLRRTDGSSADLERLWYLIAIAPAAELRMLLGGTPAQPFLEPENARMFGSIRSVAAACTAALEHVCRQVTPQCSVRQWVRAGRGVLFLPYRAGQIASLRTLIASWMRLAIFEAMNGVPGDRRLWFIVDELDALGAIDGLRDALARLRKFGGRCVLGMQSIAQVAALYGPGDAQTIIENCGNSLILRCSASERGGTAQFCSRLIGEREVIRRSISRGRDGAGGFGSGARGARRSLHISEQHVTETAVLPAQIEQLADLEGYLKTAASARWLSVRLRRAG